jgi:hypothetical protein
MGEGVILIAAVVEATHPVLVRKGGIHQGQHREQSAHENLGEPRSTTHLTIGLRAFRDEVNHI